MKRARRGSGGKGILYGALAIAAVALVIFALDSVYGFLGGSSTSSAAQRTSTVAYGTVQSSVSASGNVSVATSASADFATSGTLSAVYVRVGSKVKAGETIAKLDPTAAEAALEASQASLAQAQQALSTAEAGATSEQQATNASSLQQAQSQVTSAQQQLVTDQEAVTAAEKQLKVDQELGCPPAGSTSSSSASSNASASNASSQSSSSFTSTTSSSSSTGSQGGVGGNGSGGATSQKGIEVAAAGPGGATGATGTGGAPTTTTTTTTATGATGATGSSGSASTAAKASAPAATTGTASSIAAHTATFSGTVNPSGQSTTYWFQYGTSASSLGSKTAELGAGSGTSPVSVTANVSGLKPGKPYLFRLVAESSAGKGTGADVSFQTIDAAKPTVTTGTASSVLTTSVTLNGTVNPNGSDTSYRFEYGTTDAYGESTPTQDAGSASGAMQVTASVTGLKPNTAYLVRLVATNSSGTGVGIGQVVKTSESSCTADEATIKAAQQTVANQEQTLKTAEANLASTEASISASETPSETTIAQDKAAVSQAQATVVSDQKALEATVLKAPVAGTVTAVNGSVGDTVGGSGSSVSKGAANSSSSSSTGTGGVGGTGGNSSNSSSSSTSSTFVTIETLNRLQVVSGFAEADASNIKVGQPATVTFPALTDVEVAGKVTAISSTSTVVSNVVTYDATISLINPPREVLVGMTASVAVITDTRSHVLQLPSSAITTNGTVSTVQLLQDGQASTTRIQTGLVGDSSTEITGGVSLGDIVVVPTVSVSASTTTTANTPGGFGGGGFGGGGFGGG